MLDKLVTLHRKPAIAQMELAKAASKSYREVAVRVTARAPERQCQLKLWNRDGRKPEALKPSPWAFPEEDAYTWYLDESLDALNGRTLTWSVRLLARAPDRFELQVQVLYQDVEVPGASFTYAGPLEAGQLEERHGRFHFNVPSAQAAA